MILNLFKTLILSALCIHLSKCFNIDDFGAKTNVYSYQTGLANGKALYDAIIAANSSAGDRTVVVSAGKNYTYLPHQVLRDILDVTIQIDGLLFAWHDNVDDWPNCQIRFNGQFEG